MDTEKEKEKEKREKKTPTSAKGEHRDEKKHTSNTKEKREKKSKKSKSDKKSHHDKKEKCKEKDLQAAKYCRKESLDVGYTVVKTIGGIRMGGEFYHDIYDAKTKQGNPVIIKSIKMSDNKEEHAKLLQDLIRLKELSHKNLITVIDMFEDDTYIYLVYESDPKKLEKKAHTEKEVKNIIKQLNEAISYLHGKGVSGERIDIKVEKIFIHDNIIKLGDYGLHQSSYPTEDKLRSLQGTKSLFVAPELIMGVEDTPEVQKESDLWALGGLTYYLLAGYPPFQAESDPQLFKKIMALEFKLTESPWETISQDAKNFVSKLLVKDSKKRLTIDQIRQDVWLAS